MITGDELAAYAAGEADPGLVARVERALPDDADLAARLERIRAVDRELAALPMPVWDDAAAARLMAAVDADLAALAAGATTGAATGATTDAAGGLAATSLVDGDRSADPPAARAGGATAPGGRAPSSGAMDHLRRRLGEWFGGLGVGQLAGAAAVLLLVVGVGAVAVSGNLFSPVEESAQVSADAGGGPVQDEAGSGGSGVASGGSEEREVVAESSAAADVADGDPATIPVVDDDRVVAATADIEPTELRDRLAPLAELASPPAPTADQDAAAAEMATTESGSESGADRGASLGRAVTSLAGRSWTDGWSPATWPWSRPAGATSTTWSWPRS